MRSWPAVIAMIALAAWVACAFVTWSQGAPLGHDEAQYALGARALLAGDPPRWFYVSRGMELLATPGILLGGSELALRVVPMIAGLAFVVATWLLARRTVDSTSAAWALAVIVGTRSIARRATDLLSDVPAAACLIAALALIVDEIDRADGPRWRIVLVAPLLAAALYVRYGSAVPIAVIVVASIAVGWRTLTRRPGPVLVTIALFVVLLIPHFVHATNATGSPLGILLASRGVPQQAHIADGLVTYLTSNPFRFYGIAAAVVMLAGVVSIVPRPREPRRLLVWIVGIGSLVAMGMTTHGMSRYVLMSIALLVILGTDQIATLVQRLTGYARVVITTSLGATLALVWLLFALRQPHVDDVRRGAMRGSLIVAELVKRDAEGRPCVVVGYHSTELEWYSGCAGVDRLYGSELIYVVRDETPGWMTPKHPDPMVLPGRRTIIGKLPDLVVVRVEPSSS